MDKEVMDEMVKALVEELLSHDRKERDYSESKAAYYEAGGKEIGIGPSGDDPYELRTRREDMNIAYISIEEEKSKIKGMRMLLKILPEHKEIWDRAWDTYVKDKTGQKVRGETIRFENMVRAYIWKIKSK